MTNEPTIERRIELPKSVDRVWKAISDPEHLSRWFGDGARFDLDPGSEGTVSWESHGTFALRVESVDPPKRLVWSWMHEAGVPFDPARSTRVEFTLEAASGGGTVLRVKETGFRTESHLKENTAGWTDELAELVALLAA